MSDCKEYQYRIEYKGDTGKYIKKCAIKLKSVTSQDSGKWFCELEEYNYGYNYRGAGKQVRDQMFIEIIPNSLKFSKTSENKVLLLYNLYPGGYKLDEILN